MKFILSITTKLKFKFKNPFAHMWHIQLWLLATHHILFALDRFSVKYRFLLPILSFWNSEVWIQGESTPWMGKMHPVVTPWHTKIRKNNFKMAKGVKKCDLFHILSAIFNYLVLGLENHGFQLFVCYKSGDQCCSRDLLDQDLDRDLETETWTRLGCPRPRPWVLVSDQCKSCVKCKLS